MGCHPSGCEPPFQICFAAARAAGFLNLQPTSSGQSYDTRFTNLVSIGWIQGFQIAGTSWWAGELASACWNLMSQQRVANTVDEFPTSSDSNGASASGCSDRGCRSTMITCKGVSVAMGGGSVAQLMKTSGSLEKPSLPRRSERELSFLNPLRSPWSPKKTPLQRH